MEEPRGFGPIDEMALRQAEETLQKYQRARMALERRIIENEQWYRLRHWQVIHGSENPSDPEPASAWLLNCISNKHADAMDNFPTPIILPREPGDQADAEALSAILPVVLEQNEYEQVYSDIWWAKLKAGTGVTGVFWNPRKQNGLGDIDIRRVDVLNLYWEPGINDIQKSRHVFHVELMDDDWLVQSYPQLEGKLGGDRTWVPAYAQEDGMDTSGKSAVIDWYYRTARGGQPRLHFAKFVNGVLLLYASENDPKWRDRGLYDHGQYPFVFDAQFVEEGSPAGFGYIDVCKPSQLYIDKLNQVILKHAIMAARPRFFLRADGAINEAEYADWSNDFVHYQGSSSAIDSIKPIELPAIDPTLVVILNNKIEELKETSGNRDFSQGATSGGVTAASAIAALQEAGGKLARDMIKASYRAYVRVLTLCLELIRQFYDEPRCFRIIGTNGAQKFVAYDNRRLRMTAQGDEFGVPMGTRIPVFDIRVSAAKASPFTRVAQNELAKEFYSMGFFAPENAEKALACIEMMEFDGKDWLIKRLTQNAQAHRMAQAAIQAAQTAAPPTSEERATALIRRATDASAAVRRAVQRGSNAQGTQKERWGPAPNPA